MKATPAPRFMHMSVTREYLLRFLDDKPEEWGSLVAGAKSFEEARRFIHDGPPFHPIGKCKEYDHARGICPGHDKR